jgi:hypothetical protein
VGAELLQADRSGRTDMRKLIIAFRNFANAPKKVSLKRKQSHTHILKCILWGPSIRKKYLLAKAIMKPVTAGNKFSFIHYESNNRRNKTLTEEARIDDNQNNETNMMQFSFNLLRI